MPPRKKQKTTSTASKATSAIAEPAPDFPDAPFLTRALDKYSDAIALRSREHAKAPDDLIRLDAWLTTTLLPKVVAGEPVTKPDMTCKSARVSLSG
jgi:hypothetical protein